MESVAIIEEIMEHVAAAANMDPLELKELNLAPDMKPENGGPNVFGTSILPLLKQKAMISQRKAEVEAFNKVRILSASFVIELHCIFTYDHAIRNSFTQRKTLLIIIPFSYLTIFNLIACMFSIQCSYFLCTV